MPNSFARQDYSTLTEAPGVRVTSEALSMLYSRYRYAANHCRGKSVLEVACGAGQGLGYLAKTSTITIGGDSTINLLRESNRHYRGRIPLIGLDAHSLPFRNQSFDMVLLYEAIYYLPHPDRFLAECHRVLNGNGVLLICTVNKEWADFHPSPHSTRYFSAQDLATSLAAHHYTVNLFGALPLSRASAKDSAVSFLKHVAAYFHLIPKTMRGKETLKRLFLGPLHPVPAEVYEGMATYYEPVPIASLSRISNYKVLFALAHRC